MNTEDEVTRVPPVKNRGGVWVTLGMEAYRIPPLGFNAIQEVQEKVGLLRGMTTIPTKDQMAIVAEIIHAAISRNYPDMTVEEVKDMIDLGNFQEVLEAVLKTAGFRTSTPGEAQTTSP